MSTATRTKSMCLITPTLSPAAGDVILCEHVYRLLSYYDEDCFIDMHLLFVRHLKFFEIDGLFQIQSLIHCEFYFLYKSVFYLL